ncbi:hypothetical protein BDW75DRAFT_134042 [Aspergillus navahoensis]
MKFDIQGILREVACLNVPFLLTLLLSCTRRSVLEPNSPFNLMISQALVLFSKNRADSLVKEESESSQTQPHRAEAADEHDYTPPSSTRETTRTDMSNLAAYKSAEPRSSHFAPFSPTTQLPDLPRFLIYCNRDRHHYTRGLKHDQSQPCGFTPVICPPFLVAPRYLLPDNHRQDQSRPNLDQIPQLPVRLSFLLEMGHARGLQKDKGGPLEVEGGAAVN